MKKTLFTVLILVTSAVVTAQEYKKAIEKSFTEYLNAIANKEFEKSLDFVVPEFFDIYPKGQMIAVMEQTFNNPAIKFELKDPKILKINDAKKIENKYYSLLSYSHQMNMKVNEGAEQSEEEKKAQNSLIATSLKEEFGEGNVKYNDTTGFFEIQIEKQVYTISKNSQTDWKFLVIEKKQKAFLEKLLPKELLDTI
ncbi:hypothetical protein SGQ44_14000 [Flavobacterium sp. Fl-77]|uniref:Uncharacterized protein n=1 Tax=Flavobacterium flavipigmentatum TaxID=2893884 RepID=A0AAJ2S921_9FLAO|nr:MULTISPECIES: hypothetical protein [unclassified Flavobacterium]MDX6182072.1 hypothetical protein [Flavobacterium sp. Fl-33]MDX6186873.1 hypothetical protein [Flavobacterium sp. Fl-77]UFH37008.1 hypothetical protein LNP22_09685 [Flavobacterium sp. F-70]